MRRFFVILLLGLLFTFTVYTSMAQVEACPVIVTQALEAVGDSCQSLERNSACYGYFTVETAFRDTAENTRFSSPSDVAAINDLDVLRTLPLNLDSGEWGIAVMNAQANVPGTLPGQAVTFLLLGDTRVENAVPRDEAVDIGIGVETTTLTEALVRAEPAAEAAIIGTLAAGDSVVIADAVRIADAASIADAGSTEETQDARWLLIRFLDRDGWIRLEDVELTDALEALLAADRLAPMQAFFFSTGVGAPTCDEAPNTLTIRSPENIVVELNVNGADIRIGSTILFRQVDANAIAITVIEGRMEVLNAGEDGDETLIVETGQTLTAATENDGTISEFQFVRAATPLELDLAAVSQAVLTEISPNATVGGPLIHIVVPGDTLFSIAQTYDASMPAIITVNNIADPENLNTGQELVIPNPGDGFVGLPTSLIPPVLPPQVPGNDVTPAPVDCSPLRPTSPLGGLAYGNNQFFWDPAPGATRYQVVVTNLSTGGVVVFSTPGTETSLTANLDDGTVGGGFEFAWQVVALINDQPVCASGLFTMQRAAQNAPQAMLAARWGCRVVGATPSQPDVELAITYSGALPNDTVTITYERIVVAANRQIITETQTAQGAANTITLYVPFQPGLGTDSFQNGVVTTSSGQSVALAPNFVSC